ncbi:MAG: hypothetical protein ACFFE2_07155 [Candidatus Thorarchaeota archaeon]
MSDAAAKKLHLMNRLKDIENQLPPCTEQYKRNMIMLLQELLSAVGFEEKNRLLRKYLDTASGKNEYSLARDETRNPFHQFLDILTVDNPVAEGLFLEYIEFNVSSIEKLVAEEVAKYDNSQS